MKVLLASVVTALIAAPTLKVDTQEWTYGLASAGGSVWAGGLALGDVVRIDPASGKVTKRINVGARVFNLAAAPGAVWAVANLSSTVSRIDARTGRVTARCASATGRTTSSGASARHGSRTPPTGRSRASPARRS